MKKLNKTASKIMEKIMSLNVSKIDNTEGSFMPLCVEVIGKVNGINKMAAMGSGRIISLAHYYEQNGDLMSDPEMIFFESEDIDKNKTYYPMSYSQAAFGIYRESIILDEKGELSKINRREQADEVSFANTWLKNIKSQQKL